MTTNEIDLLVEMIKSVKGDIKDLTEKVDGLFQNGPITNLQTRVVGLEKESKVLKWFSGVVLAAVIIQLIERFV